MPEKLLPAEGRPAVLLTFIGFGGRREAERERGSLCYAFAREITPTL